MTRMRLSRWLSLIGFVAVMGAYGPAFAELVIHVCGHSTYTCPETYSPSASFGRAGGVLISDSESGKSVHIPIGTSNNAHIPPGWTDANTPPATAASVPGPACWPAGAGCHATASGWAAAATAADPTFNFYVTSVVGDNIGYYGCQKSSPTQTPGCTGYFTSGVSASHPETCPAGYANPISGVCELTNASLAQKPSDGRCAVVRTGNVYGKDTRDPDCGSGTGTAATDLNLSTTGGLAQSAQGDYIIWIDLNPTSGEALVKLTQPTGQQTTQQQLAFGPPAGSDAPVTGRAEIVTSGTGTLQGAGSAGSGGGGGSCGGVGQPPCKIDETGTPTTGSGAADGAKAALTGKTPGDFGVEAWGGDGVSPFSHLPAVAGSDECVNPISWVWMGIALTPDICAIWGPLKGWLAWFLYAMTAIYIWKRTTTALG